MALYIRKILSPTFLNTEEIVENQNNRYEKLKNLSADEKKYCYNEMNEII